ncbi:hypothetical protein O3G_MSEX002079, partial [Manduca sexta]
VGDGLSSASHVIGSLTPGTWYEVCVEAYSDAGKYFLTSCLISTSALSMNGQQSMSRLWVALRAMGKEG